MDVRLRMVMVGLVLGVLVAIVVAVEGCGHHAKPRAAAVEIAR